MDDAFRDEFKELFLQTKNQIEDVFDLLATDMPEMAMNLYRNLGKALPDYIRKAQKLPEPCIENLIGIKERYIDWLKAQLKSCELFQKHLENPNGITLKQWRDSFTDIKKLQNKLGRLIFNSQVFQNLSEDQYVSLKMFLFSLEPIYQKLR